jgi:hypothetical protein
MAHQSAAEFALANAANSGAAAKITNWLALLAIAEAVRGACLFLGCKMDIPTAAAGAFNPP